MAQKPVAELSDLLTQLKVTNRLLAAQLKGTMPQNSVIKLLGPTGLTHQEIAEIVDTTAATVQNTLQRAKRK